EAVGARYSKVSGKGDFQLDFEYKKDANLGLVVKQVREIPKSTNTGETTAFLINEPTTWRLFQGELGDIFSNHRLKTIWSLNTATFRLQAANLTEGLYRDASVQYLNSAAIVTLSGPINTWPNAVVSTDAVTNFWRTGSGADQRA